MHAPLTGLLCPPEGLFHALGAHCATPRRTCPKVRMRTRFSVEDCAQEKSLVVPAGGKVARPKFSIGEFGWVTLCEDTEGNLFGLSSMK